MHHNLDIQSEVLQRLESDSQINFKHKNGSYLTGGVCPRCGQREAYVDKKSPWKVYCNRRNNCDAAISVRELYEDLFTEYSERFPITREDENATARQYLFHGRGFNTKLLDGMYKQAQLAIYSDTGQLLKHVPTVRFEFEGTYWERLIDKSAVQAYGNKAHFPKGGKFKGTGWQPPGQTIKKGDQVFETEGIFDAIALLHMENPPKVISAMSSGNRPTKIYEANKGKGVTWVSAFDADKAGLAAARKFRDIMRQMGEDFLIAIPPFGKDWNDLHEDRTKDTAGISKETLDKCFLRGRTLLSETTREKAFWIFSGSALENIVRFDFNNALYRGSVDADRKRDNLGEMDAVKSPWQFPEKALEEYQTAFENSLLIEKISNCVPDFRYIEKDEIQGDQYYYFKVAFESGNEPCMVDMDGSSLVSRSGFSTALMNRTAGGLFDGTDKDLKFYRDRWFSRKTNEVRAVPFVGYDKQSQTYVYPYGAYHKGRFVPVNSDGYMSVSKTRIKTSLRSYDMDHSTRFQREWLADFYAAFSTNGLVVLSWWLGTLFAEQVRNLNKSWPFMELTGDQGAGKTTVIEFLWKLVGRENQEGFDPSKSTHAGRARSFVQASNLPVVLIEGDRNSDDRGAKRGSFDMDELKDTYNGRPFRSMGVAKRGADTESMPFRGGIMIAQNATVDGSEALLARIVHCHADRAHFSKETEKAAKRLEQLPASEVAGFLHYVLINESNLLQAYQHYFSLVHPMMATEFPEIQNRLILNHSQVLAWAHVLPMIFGKHLVTAEMLDAVKMHLVSRAQDRQDRLKADHPMVQQFWEIYESENDNVQAGALKMTEFFNHSKNQERIAINLVDFQKKCGIRGLDRQLDFMLLKKLLPGSQRYPFEGQKTVASQLLQDKRVKCWVFIKPKQEKG